LARILTSADRIRTRRRASRTSGGAIHPSGNRLVEQMRQRLGVDRVVLHPRRGDRLGRQRMRHVRRHPELGQLVGKPAPAVGRFERHLDRPRPQLVDHLLNRRRASADLAVEEQPALLVDGGDLRLLAMKVDSDVNHPLGLLLVGR
jgi:hypothetical protein